MDTDLPTIAGIVSTALFAAGTFPMLVKASRTRNLGSYSLSNLLSSNVGNVIYSLCVLNLPPGPIWFLHSYYLISTALMLVWYLRYESWPRSPRSNGHQATARVLPALCCSPTG